MLKDPQQLILRDGVFRPVEGFKEVGKIKVLSFDFEPYTTLAEEEIDPRDLQMLASVSLNSRTYAWEITYAELDSVRRFPDRAERILSDFSKISDNASHMARAFGAPYFSIMTDPMNYDPITLDESLVEKIRGQVSREMNEMGCVERVVFFTVNFYSPRD